MTSPHDPQALEALRELAAMLREPLSRTLTQLLDQHNAPTPPPAAPAAALGMGDLTTLRYQLALGDLAVLIRTGAPPEQLLAWIGTVITTNAAVHPQRAALDAVAAAAEELRAALAARDAELGLVWMYDHATVCRRWDALDAAFDTLSAARQAVGIDEELLEQGIAEAVQRIAAGDSSGRSLLISLLGDTAGQVLARLLRRLLRQPLAERA